MNEKVKQKFNDYPAAVRTKMLEIRKLILDEACRNNLGNVEESLKWGEPSYNVKGGSAIRCDWKEKCPDRYAIYFNCKTKLVDTFKELYGHQFEFEGNRAIVLGIYDPIPEQALRHCFRLAFRYHKIKHLPLLGA